MAPIIEMVQALAHRRGVRLAPDWTGEAPGDLALDDPNAIERLSVALGWEAPRLIERKPRANAFPLMLFHPELGWGLAEQWQSADELRVVTVNGYHDVPWSADIHLVAVNFPKDVQSGGLGRAGEVFWSAISRRRRMLVEASVATIVINIIALATSLYTMQVYDRVIPRSGFSTLWVLTVGMIFALLVDFLIRNIRSFMVDREAAGIDAEVSEYFFARLQAVRLDARTGGIGTMAGQLRGLEQVRAIMASASLFVLADLPFALIFLLVIASIGGAVVVVPLLIFPLSLAFAYLFSRLIREDTARTLVSSNRKNGLLVETLDAAETIKANLGGWHMLAAWNNLVDNVHSITHPTGRIRKLRAQLLKLGLDRLVFGHLALDEARGKAGAMGDALRRHHIDITELVLRRPEIGELDMSLLQERAYAVINSAQAYAQLLGHFTLRCLRPLFEQPQHTEMHRLALLRDLVIRHARDPSGLDHGYRTGGDATFRAQRASRTAEGLSFMNERVAQCEIS